MVECTHTLTINGSVNGHSLRGGLATQSCKRRVGGKVGRLWGGREGVLPQTCGSRVGLKVGRYLGEGEKV